ncbi:inorganic phosphate transporter [Gephyromycinifex aptenodytis]|uniref:inorganic phosphate transporter n=1 Tax=Gephyromycinifex aptenodytis TaxID=2716227 RepID=UPI00144671D1|nr:inorganic phosphate transporter [Gephyromycinifex aptenodytis]
MASSTVSSPPATDTGSSSTALDRSLNLGFGTAMAVTLALFTWWAFGYVANDASRVILILAVAFGLFMAFNIGGNDVANSFGTSVGAGTLTIQQALLVASVFEVSGAIIAGGQVTDTIRKGIVDLSGTPIDPQDFIFIMMAALFAAAVWLLIASRSGWPVSTTHSIIGGIVGAAVTLGWLTTGSDALGMVQWDQVVQIAISWVLSPLLGGIASYLLFRLIKSKILTFNDEAEEQLRRIKAERLAHRDRHKESFERLSEIQQISYTGAMARDAAALRSRGDEDGTLEPDDLESDYYRELQDIDRRAVEIDSHQALQNWVPALAAIGAVVISAMLLFKGLENLDLGLSALHNVLIMAMVGATVWMAMFIFARTLRGDSLSRSTFVMFSWMQVFTASGFAFSHGSNDIANAIGPFAAVLETMKNGQIGEEAVVPTAAMVAFGVALIAGLWFVGRRVIATVGTNLTKMHPASGFAAELSAAAVVMSASAAGLPVSSTHILIGAVLGIGYVNKAANWGLMRPIAMAWVITLPAAAALAAGALLVLRFAF